MNYPGGTKITKRTNISHKNRGMTLENDINQTNDYYIRENKAIIHKRPTPIKIVKVDYVDGFERIVNAFFEKPSTTDYCGIYKGFYVDFEAKETSSNTSFPLGNIHKHQWEHMKQVLKHGGICFLIVRFSKLDQTFLVKAEDLLEKIETNKSISLSFFKEKGWIIKFKLNKPVDYIEIIDKMYFKGAENEQKES
jgi:recombination protein U